MSKLAEVSLKLEHKRYFTNPFVGNPTELAKIVTDEWIKEKVDKLAKRLIEQEIKDEDCKKGGCYTGIGGIAFSFLRVALAFKDKQKDYLIQANKFLESQMKHAKTARPEKFARYLTGTSGLLVIQAMLNHVNGKSNAETFKTLEHLVETVVKSEFENEILNGRSGFLAGILILRRFTGKNVITDDAISRILKRLIKEGRKYSHDSRHPAPLMYEWHEKEYIGAAHGISGIYQILLSYAKLLDEDAKDDLKKSIDWLLTVQDEDGNFPSSSGHIGKSKGEDELVHWCHGATGVIQLLITAHLTYQEELKYFESAKKAAVLICQKGILRKGPGLCHGVAGNGYAFLTMYRLTSDIEYLEKAKVFAAIMLDPNFEKMARTPDNPNSLFEGWAGALCFLCDLLSPTSATFPMIPIVFGTPDFK